VESRGEEEAREEDEGSAQEEQGMTYKRGKFYWYKFMWNGTLVRESTKQGNDKVARSMESAHRTSLAKGEVGIREKKPSPTLAEFIDKRFEPSIKARFEKSSPKTWLDWYRPNLRAIKAYKPLANTKLDEITTERASDFAARRQEKGLQISSVNSSLRVLRRVLRVAVEWGACPAAPKLKLLPGERHRERVISQNEEARYLTVAPDLLAGTVTILVDTGMRPEECFRLRWESITWTNGRHGTVLITHGKTAAARRVLPMTPRVRAVLEARWERAEQPEEGWVFTAPTKSGHVEKSTLKKQHKGVFKTLKDEAEKNDEKPVRPFVLYDLRHTFLTRLGESGCDVWTLARIAGHSNIKQSSRYVHPSGDAVLDAMERMGEKSGGHKIGHNAKTANRPTRTQRLLTQ
jgi:integrase